MTTTRKKAIAETDDDEQLANAIRAAADVLNSAIEEAFRRRKIDTALRLGELSQSKCPQVKVDRISRAL